MSKKFKKGQRISCVENTIYKDELTLGEIYNVIGYMDRSNSEIYLLNDEGVVNFYPQEYFGGLDKVRNKIIDDILIDES